MKKWIIALFVVVVVAAVAWRLKPRPMRGAPPVMPVHLDPKVVAEIGAAYAKDVQPIFKRSCMDCHSGDTVWPWYHSIPGVRQYLDGHVEDGRHDLELGKGFPFNTDVPLPRHLRRIGFVVKDGKMPLWDYALMHKDARLSEADKAVIVKWAEDGFQRLSATAKD